MFSDQFTNVRDACAFAQGIVDTTREPLVVLDQNLRVVAASGAFFSAFNVKLEDTLGVHLYALGDGQWDIPKLRVLLEKIIPERGVMEDYEVEHEFPGLGHRTMCLNARRLSYEKDAHTNILLGIEDVTARRALEQEKDDLLRQKDVLLEEIQHRVANSLQIIASIIMMKAMAVESQETRRHLQDAHQRVLSIAAVQQHLHAVARSEPVQLAPYLTKLCQAIAHSMIGDHRSISLQVRGEEGSASCGDAESIGLIVTELVINSIKHAFGKDTKDGKITVAFEVSGKDWKLSVTDNGVGRQDGVFAQPKSGLGTGIVAALAKQLDAKIETLSGPGGTSVSVTHATFEANKIRAREKQTA